MADDAVPTPAGATRLDKGASPLNNFAGRTGTTQKETMLITVGIYRPHTEAQREAALKEQAKLAGYRFIFTDKKWLADFINKTDAQLHRIAAWWGCQTYGCSATGNNL